MNTTTTRCDICKRNFTKRCNLRAHIKRFHPGKLEELAPKKAVKCAAICNACGKSFVKYSNLRQHVKIFHKDIQDQLIEAKEYTYKCDECHKQFSHSRHFKSHLKSHQEHNSSGLECILCKNSSESDHFQKSDLFEHFHKRHDINVVTEMFQFTSIEELEKWKKYEENETSELFVNAHGTDKSKNHTKTKYVCHRSGTYKGKGSCLRHLKTQGSKKIGGYCPAEMCVTATDGKYEVKYVKTHVGHSNDLGHFNSTQTERQALAMQIASRIPSETLLDQVRESVCKDDYHDSTVEEKVDNQEELRITDLLSKSKTDLNTAHFSVNKEKLRHELLQIIDSLDNSEELVLVKNIIAPLQPTLTAFRNSKTKSCEKSDQKVQHNKKNNQQRRLFKTKKAKSKRTVLQLSKIDSREANEVALNLLL